MRLKDIRQLLDTKKISAVELTQEFLTKISQSQPELNAFVTVSTEEAMLEARHADELLASGGENPTFLGVPYAAKDNFCTKGIRTTASSLILDNYRPPYDASVVKTLKSQYGVLLGKTNLDQFAHGSSTETSAYGPSRNPWDTSRIPGGSSGGSAVAVAADLVPFALATETGGSIRQPSSLCGVSGWKPTYGRVSRYGVVAMGSSLDSIGAMAGSVEDLALIAEVVSGKDERDSTSSPLPVPSYVRNLTTNLQGVKIGVPKEYFIDGMEEGVKVAVSDAIHILQKLGAEIIDVTLPYTKYGSLVYAIVCPSEVSSNLARYDGIRYGHTTSEGQNLLDVYMKSRAEGFGNEAKRRILTGTYVLSAGYYDAYYKKAQKVRRLIVNDFNRVFSEVDAIVAPSVPNVAPKIGSAAEDPLFGYIADQLNIPGALAGLPALSIPCGLAKSTDGSAMDLPVGLQVMGKLFDEQTVFNIGHAFQCETNYHTLRPPMINALK